MKYAIVESGGKQYKAVEGETIEVDRLPVNAGDKVDLERVLMLVDGDAIAVGTPIVNGTQVKTTVVDHFKGPKIIVFKYSPRKRIRVKGGHRQQYTRLMVNAISKSKATKAKKSETPVKKAEPKAEKKVEKKEATTAKPAAKKAPAKKTEKTTAKKAPAKKTTTKKTTTTTSPKEKKTSSTETTKK